MIRWTSKWIFTFILFLGFIEGMVLANCKTEGCPAGSSCSTQDGTLGCYPLACPQACASNQTCHCLENENGKKICSCQTNCEGLVCSNPGDCIHIIDGKCVCNPCVTCPTSPCCDQSSKPNAASKTISETKPTLCEPSGTLIVQSCATHSEPCAGSKSSLTNGSKLVSSIISNSYSNSKPTPNSTETQCVPTSACRSSINNCPDSMPTNQSCNCVETTCNDGCSQHPLKVCNTVCIPNNCGYKISNCFGALGCKCHVDSTCDNGCGGTDSVMICEPIITPTPHSTLPLPTN